MQRALIIIILLLILLFIINACTPTSEYYTDPTSEHPTPIPPPPQTEFIFILTRHVTSEWTNNYWIEAYTCIRNIYPNKIVIIDDNSNQDFIKYDIELINVEVIQSEYPGAGELLPYFYFYKNKYAPRAVIIHDSVFIMKHIDFGGIRGDIKFLWTYNHWHDDTKNEKLLIGKLNNSPALLKRYDMSHTWTLCYGVMSVINYDFLAQLQDKYNLLTLVNYANTRKQRMCIERIFGLLCCIESSGKLEDITMFGMFHGWTNTYSDYVDYGPLVMYGGVVKILSGR